MILLTKIWSKVKPIVDAFGIPIVIGVALFFVVKKFFFSKADSVKTAEDELEKMKHDGHLLPNHNPSFYQSLATQFHERLGATSLNKASWADMSPLMYQVRSYQDYLSLVKAFGEKSTGIGWGKADLDTQIAKGADYLSNAFWVKWIAGLEKSKIINYGKK